MTSYISTIICDPERTRQDGYPTRGRALEAVGCVCEFIDAHAMTDDILVAVANSTLDALLEGLRNEQAFV